MKCSMMKAKVLLMCALALVGLFPMLGCQSDNPNAPVVDWTPFVRAVDAAVTEYIAVKFPEPTPEQSLAMSIKAIALEAAIIYMQRNNAPTALIAEQRAKADAAYGANAPAVRESARPDAEKLVDDHLLSF